MLRLLVARTIAAGTSLILTGAATAQKEKAGDQRPLKVAAAKVDITPTFPIRLAGYAARRVEIAKIVQRLWAKALVIDTGGPNGPAVLVTVDNCGVPRPVVEAVAARLARSVELTRSRFVLTSTHTHSAPALRGYAPMLFPGPLPAAQRKHIDTYTDGLIDKLCDVVERAMQNRRPGRLAWGQGQVRFAANRRVLRNRKWSGFGVQAGGPVDHDLPVMRVSGADGRLIAVVVNYACHCTGAGVNAGVCGDWAGYAQEFLEKAHPGALALITIGCGADANPRPRGTVATTRAHGREIADETNRLLSSNLTSLTDGRLETTLRWVKLPFAKLPPRTFWERRARLRGPVGFHARTNLARLDAGQKLPVELEYPIATWAFGDDLLMVFLGGEVVVDYSIYSKRLLDSRRLWITGWANDVPCYIPSQRILREGGYEADSSMVYYDKPTRFAPGVESIILDDVKAQAPKTYHSKNPRADTPSPSSPAEALSTMTLDPSLEIELVAAEPLVVDPVAFDWGPDGRLWVVEMRDYPLRGKGDFVPAGRVKVLTDEDGDGDYDAATVFLDDLPYPTGIKVWRKGVLISAAPDILFAADSNGDGKADVRRKLYTGFGEGNQQHRVNGLRWRLDNWLQVANGDSNGSIRSVKTGAATNVRGRDLRIQVDKGLLDAQSGSTQYGTSRDDWGNWFGGDNSNPLWHYVLVDHFLRRNPSVTPPPSRRRLVGTIPVYPTSRTLERFNDFDMRNRFTSACSPMIYRDDLFGAGFAGSWFVCEPVHNLVHRQVLKRDGVTFTTARPAAERQREFLTSSDNWFRPSMIRTGPDGALWVADMYRFVIEHPKWIPTEWQAKLDLRAGSDRGRIYRVYPRGRRPRRMPRLDRLDTAGLIGALDSPNGWQRDMAQQLLVWSGSAAAVEPLEAAALQNDNPLVRLHAMYALDGLGRLRAPIVVTLMADRHPGVRRHAVGLSARFVGSSETEKAAAELLKRVADTDALVRMQVAYTLGQWQDTRAAVALTTLARRDGSDEYMRAAILSSAVPHADRMLISLLGDEERRAVLGPLFATAAASADGPALSRILRAVTESSIGGPRTWKFTALRQIFDAAPQRAGRLASAAAPLFTAARTVVVDSGTTVAERVAAAGLLGREPDKRDADIQRLFDVLRPQTPIELQLAAVAALSRIADGATAMRLLAAWTGLGPRVRLAVLDVLITRKVWASALLDHAAKKPTFARQIDPARRATLMVHRDGTVRSRARKMFGHVSTSSRAALIEKYVAGIAAGAGDATKGRALFMKHCAVCHRLQGIGSAVGPDIAALTDRSPRSLIVAILDPNRAVEAKYMTYFAELRDGRSLAGVIADESGASVELRGVDGTATLIPRRDLSALRSTGTSLMPDGLQAMIDTSQMRDLIRYLRILGPAPKEFPNNRPELVRPDAAGVLTLPASKAKIFGSRMIFEQKYRNLGWWQRPDDHVVWTIETKKAGRYRVEFDYACADSDALNPFQLLVGAAKLTGKVESTGTWDHYRTTVVGEIRLGGHLEEVVIRPIGDPRGALIDLRTVRLIPSRK